MNQLGIYFGLKVITVVEAKGKTILNSFSLPRTMLAAGSGEEKVPDELKVAILLQEELRKRNIQTKDVVLSLSGRDLIIRNFEIPSLPSDEIHNAVSFEAKKYIPFKVEELVSDFQIQFDKASRRNLVLFVGIKKEVMDKNFSILQQMNMRPTVIEYSAFSLLRFVRLAGIGNRGIIGVISSDFEEEDEVHFTILENGFPLFSRDITLIGRPEEMVVPGAAKKPDLPSLFEKLKTEIRISLDYYDRKLPTKNIEKTYLLCPPEYQQTLENLLKDMGLAVHFIDASKLIGSKAPFSLSLIKSYGCALHKTIKAELTIDLVSAKTKQVKPTREKSTELDRLFALASDFKLSAWSIITGVVILIATIAYGQYRAVPLKKEVASLLALRPAVTSVNTDSSFDELAAVREDKKKRIEALQGLVKRSWYLTEQLNIIPRLIPDAVWLYDYMFQKTTEDRIDLVVHGYAYVADPDKEIKLINTFAVNLREDPKFSKYMKDITITSIERAMYEGFSVSTFTLTCRGEVRRQ